MVLNAQHSLGSINQLTGTTTPAEIITLTRSVYSSAHAHVTDIALDIDASSESPQADSQPDAERSADERVKQAVYCCNGRLC
jgi:hypothetical protein